MLFVAFVAGVCLIAIILAAYTIHSLVDSGTPPL